MGVVVTESRVTRARVFRYCSKYYYRGSRFESLLVERSSDTLNPLSAVVKSGDREGQAMPSDTIIDGSEEVVLMWAHRCGAPHSDNDTLQEYYSGY
jgi:hypothetical protein